MMLALIAPAAPERFVVVAPNGSDSAPGTLARPVATLRRARDLARALPKHRPIRIVLRGGTYRLKATLALGKEDSGVVWSAAKGEKAVISGGVPLKGWDKTTVNGLPVWRLRLPDVASGSWNFRSLYGGDDARRPRAKSPNNGFFVVGGLLKRAPGESDDWLSGRDRFVYREGDLKPAPDIAQGELTVLTQWCDSRLPITSLDPERRLVASDKFTVQSIGDDTRYWVENVRQALDQPGEWTLDRRNGELTYLPRRGEDPMRTVLIAPRVERLVSLDGTENVRFEGLAFEHAEWWYPKDFRGEGRNEDKLWAIQQGASTAGAAFFADKVRNVAVEGCRFAHVGAFGMKVDGPSQGVRIAHCRFEDLGGGGVLIGRRDGSSKQPDEEVSRDHEVSDNVIRGGGRILVGAVGIFAPQVRRTKIVHNEISGLYYSGISCGWFWGFGDGGAARDNTIAWNHIHDLGQEVMGDGSGIYTLGTQPGTVIEGNVVHDVNGTYASRGIYLDDGSSEIVVRNNLAYRNRTANYFQWRSKNVLVENNVFAYAKESQLEFGGAVFNGGVPALLFQRNIVLANERPLLNAFEPNNVKSIYTFQKNLYWRANGSKVMPDNAKAAGWGKDSVEADPLFVAPEKGDFRLREGSPAAMAIGFKPVDWSKAGPRR